MRIFTLGDLVLRSKQRCDMENNDSIDTDEWKNILQSVNAELYGIVADIDPLYWRQERKFTSVASGYATATLTAAAKANLVDAETFELHDGYGKLVFEIDVAGTGISVADRITCNVSGDTTAIQVATTLHTAINAATHVDGTAFGITSTDNGDGTLTLTNDVAGRLGNQKTAESVAYASTPSTRFKIADFTGGGDSYPLPVDMLTLLGVDYLVNSTTGERSRLRWIMHPHRNLWTGDTGAHAAAFSLEGQYIRLYPPGASGEVYYMIYVPQAPDLVHENDNYQVDVVTADGENFLLWGAAVTALQSRRQDVSGALAERERARSRVVNWAQNRVAGESRYQVVDDEYDEPWAYDAGDWRWNRP